MKKFKEEFKTMHGVFDEFTNRTIFKLISQHHFDGLIGPISLGKEAVVFQAKKDNEKVSVKVYRLETCDFNRMYDYLKYDPRFKVKRGKRNIIFTWAQREYRNLLKAREANVSAPKPISIENNVLVMEFIGNENPAPKLKDSEIKNPKEFFDEIIKNIKRLYKAELVHTDLSQFNILNHHQRPVFIDFSQCTSLENPNFKEYLERDIRNIIIFFERFNLKLDEKKIKEKIIE